MHPIIVLISAALALLIYSNFVFFTRPPAPQTNNFTVVLPEEAEKERVKNIPFYLFGIPVTARHTFAGRQDKLLEGKIHKIKAEPRSQRYIVLKEGAANELIVKAQLDNRFTTMVKLPPGYSLFLPPTWRAQIEVPTGTECMLYSSDSLGSLCLRLPELGAPIASKVAEAAHPFLAVCFSTLDKLIWRLQCLLGHVEEPSKVPKKFASYHPSARFLHPPHQKRKDSENRHSGSARQPKEARKDQKTKLAESSNLTTLSKGENNEAGTNK